MPATRRAIAIRYCSCAESEVQALIDALSRKHLLLENVRLRQPGAEIPAALLQHRIQRASVHAAGAGHRLRAAAARPADAGRTAQTRGAHGRLRRCRASRGGPGSAGDAPIRPAGARLPREPGRREPRYAHLFGADNAASGAPLRRRSRPRRPPRATPAGAAATGRVAARRTSQAAAAGRAGGRGQIAARGNRTAEARDQPHP